MKKLGEHRNKILKKEGKDHNHNITFRTLISYSRDNEFRRWRKNVRAFSRTGHLDEAFNVRIAKAEMLITKNPELRRLRVATGRQDKKKRDTFLLSTIMHRTLR